MLNEYHMKRLIKRVDSLRMFCVQRDGRNDEDVKAILELRRALGKFLHIVDK